MADDRAQRLLVALTDLRSTLEARLRTLTATEVCVDYYSAHRDPESLREAKKLLESIMEERRAAGEILRDACASIAALMGSGPPSAAADGSGEQALSS